MADGWERPTADGEPAPVREAVIDVPLTGETAAPGADADDQLTNWRRSVGIAAAVGAALGIVVAAWWSAGDDTPEAAPDTDPAVEVSITTPPTLRPLETLPSPRALPDTAVGTTPPARPPATPATPEAAVTVPTYPPAADPGPLDHYDVAAAIAANDDDVARRSDTHVELGSGGYILDVSIERDPERDRYRLVLSSNGLVEEVIVDVASGNTYISPGTDTQAVVRNSDIVGVDGDINTYFDRMLRGPLRPETYDADATLGRGIVEIDGVGAAREFVATVEGTRVPEWQIYAFGPVGEFVPSERPELLAYTAYVDDTDRIVEVNGVAMLGNVPQLVQHRTTLLDSPAPIELPAATTLTGTSAPGTPEAP